MQAAGLAAAIANINAAFGVNLMLPGAMVALQAKLDAMATLSASLMAGSPMMTPALGNLMQLAAAASATARMQASIMSSVAMAGLAASLKLMAQIQLPTMAVSSMDLGTIVNMLMALTGIQSTFGVNMLSVNAALRLQAAIQGLPLAAIAQLKISESLMAMATLGTALSPLKPLLGMSLTASATASIAASLQAMAAIRLPGLAPISLMATLVAQMNGLGFPALASSACSPSCPVGSKLRV
jgi:hypothetical protein